MRTPRLALWGATGVGAVALTALAVGGPAGARPAAGACRAPQLAAVVSPDGRVEPASASSHVPPGWRVLCWPPRFYTGTVVKGRTSKRSEDTKIPYPNSPPDVDTLRSNESRVLTFNLLFELTSAGIGPTGGNARYTLSDSFVSARIDGEEVKVHT
ncbi:MAG: hypothetical protein ACXVZO_07855, partial [Gaiellaceae bacterium]